MNAKADVKTAGRTLDVFEAFEAIRKPQTLSELAAHIGTPISSCHGLVRTLRNRGYIYSVGGRGAFYPTKRLLDVATIIAVHDPVLEQLGPSLVALRDLTAETVLLGKRQDDRIVYLEVVEGLHTIRYAAKPGKMTPLHSSAIGKAMLGTLTPADLETLLRTHRFERITTNTLTAPALLSKDIAEGRERGYFITRGENVADVMAIARTVRVGSGPLGIAVAGPLPRMEANLGAYAERLIATCALIEDDVS